APAPRVVAVPSGRGAFAEGLLGAPGSAVGDGGPLVVGSGADATAEAEADAEVEATADPGFEADVDADTDSDADGSGRALAVGSPEFSSDVPSSPPSSPVNSPPANDAVPITATAAAASAAIANVLRPPVRSGSAAATGAVVRSPGSVKRIVSAGSVPSDRSPPAYGGGGGAMGGAAPFGSGKATYGRIRSGSKSSAAAIAARSEQSQPAPGRPYSSRGTPHSGQSCPVNVGPLP
ncbi:hypothetical protein P3L51_30285, partial [Streptomyces sp. PSRA5]